MSAPEPDWTAAVMRGWRSLALMVSRVTSAPSALEASGIWRLSSTSDSGMKSTQRTQWSLVPWAKAGARRAARMPSIPPAAAAATPAVCRKRRRPRDRVEASLLSWFKMIPLGWSDTRGISVKCGELLTKKPPSVNEYPRPAPSRSRRRHARRCGGPERGAPHPRHGAEGPRAQKNPRIGPEPIVEEPAPVRAEPHADAGDEED